MLTLENSIKKPRAPFNFANHFNNTDYFPFPWNPEKLSEIIQAYMIARGRGVTDIGVESTNIVIAKCENYLLGETDFIYSVLEYLGSLDIDIASFSLEIAEDMNQVYTQYYILTLNSLYI